MNGLKGKPGVKNKALILIILVAWLARFAFIFAMPAMPNAPRSMDVANWFHVGKVLMRGENPYVQTTYLNWPPLWVFCAGALHVISCALGIHIFRPLQIFLIGIETGLIVALYRLLKLLAPNYDSRALLIVGVALNPVAILLVCQHGNFDVLVALWVALFLIYLIQFNRSGGQRDWLLACLFLGLGILTKTVPVILLPVLILGLKRLPMKQFLMGAGLAILPTAIGVSILYCLAPAATWERVICYRADAEAAWTGFIGILRMTAADWLVAHYPASLIFTAIGGITAICFWKRPEIEDRNLILLSAILFLLIPVVGSGFAFQWAYWFLPLLVVSYACYGRAWQALLLLSYGISSATYIAAYAFAPSLGRFWYRRWPSEWTHSLRNLFDFPRGFWLTLPMYVVFFLLILFGIVILLCRRNPCLTAPSPAER